MEFIHKMAKNKTKKTAGMIFPPPFIYLISIIIGILANLAWKMKIFPDSMIPRSIAGTAIIAVGVFIFVNSFRALEKAKTPIQPYKPTIRIVKTGPYSFSRNPVYLSFALVQLGIAFLLNNPWVLASLIPAVAIVYTGVILREEKYLESKFGKEYSDYKKSVRRWV